jgi:WD40 repeat protein
MRISNERTLPAGRVPLGHGFEGDRYLSGSVAGQDLSDLHNPRQCVNAYGIGGGCHDIRVLFHLSVADRWELRSNAFTVFVAPGSPPAVYPFTPAGLPLVMPLDPNGADDNGPQVRLWNRSNGAVIRDLREGDAEWESIAFAPTGHTLAAGTGEKLIYLWDALRGVKTGELSYGDSNTDPIIDLEYSPDGQTLVSARGATLTFWNLATQNITATINHEGQLFDLKFSPDGTEIMAGDERGYVVFWDVATQNQTKEWQVTSGEVRTVAFAPDALHVAIGTSGGRAVVWAVTTEEEVFYVENPDAGVVFNPVGSLVYSEDGRSLIMRQAGDVFIWSADSRSTRPRHTWDWDNLSISAVVQFPGEGRLVGVASGFGYPRKEMRLWDFTTGEVEGQLSRYAERVVSDLVMSQP